MIKNIKIAVVIGNEFLNNNAGGGLVLFSNLNTLSGITKNVNLYLINDNGIFKLINYEKILDLNVLTIQDFKKILTLSRLLPFKYRKAIANIIFYNFYSRKYRFFWVEHFYNLPRLTRKIHYKKVIYSLHDLLYKIKRYRENSINLDSEEFENTRIANCRGIVLGNKYEELFISKSWNRNTLYLPINFDVKNTSINCSHNLIFYHLGSAKTTASRLGLFYFLKNIWSLFDTGNEFFKLNIIGEQTSDTEYELYKFSNIAIHGFLVNPEEVLIGMPIQIVPWNKPTGQRTRIIEAMSKGHIVFGYDCLNQIFPELIHGKNVLLFANDSDMIQGLYNIINDVYDLGEIQRNAIETVRKYFSIENRIITLSNYLLELNKSSE